MIALTSLIIYLYYISISILYSILYYIYTIFYLTSCSYTRVATSTLIFPLLFLPLFLLFNQLDVPSTTCYKSVHCTGLKGQLYIIYYIYYILLYTKSCPLLIHVSLQHLLFSRPKLQPSLPGPVAFFFLPWQLLSSLSFIIT